MMVRYVVREGIEIPRKENNDDSYLILCTSEDVTVKAHGKALAPTGLFVMLERGTEAIIRGRKELALHGCPVIKLPLDEAILDADIEVLQSSISYSNKNEIGILIRNYEWYDLVIPKGTRLAELVVVPVVDDKFKRVGKLDD